MRIKLNRKGFRSWTAGVILAAVGLAGVACDENPADPEDPTPPTFQDTLHDWFSTYNEGQTTDYLTQTGEVYPDGDEVNYPDAADHTYITNRSYGPFPRNVMDLYLPDVENDKMPVVVFIHGGGFTGNDKSDVPQKADIAAYLEEGFAVVSANYRWASNTDEGALNAPIPNGECSTSSAGCRKDYIFRDGARVIQYLRYASDELNLDPDRIGVWGTSAGGQIATWIGTVPDLADPDREDPVLQQSTRIQAVGHSGSQVSGYNMIWPEVLDFSPELWDALGWYDVEVDQRLQSTNEALRTTKEGQTLTRIVDYLGAITEDDPPIITAGNVNNHSEERMLDPENVDAARGWFVHHPKHSTPVYERCLEAGLACSIATKILVEGEHVDAERSANENVQVFFMAHLSN